MGHDKVVSWVWLMEARMGRWHWLTHDAILWWAFVWGKHSEFYMQSPVAWGALEHKFWMKLGRVDCINHSRSACLRTSDGSVHRVVLSVAKYWRHLPFLPRSRPQTRRCVMESTHTEVCTRNWKLPSDHFPDLSAFLWRARSYVMSRLRHFVSTIKLWTHCHIFTISESHIMYRSHSSRYS